MHKYVKLWPVNNFNGNDAYRKAYDNSTKVIGGRYLHDYIYHTVG